MKQGNIKLEKEKGQAKTGWTRLKSEASDLNLWSRSASTTVMGLQTEEWELGNIE